MPWYTRGENVWTVQIKGDGITFITVILGASGTQIEDAQVESRFHTKCMALELKISTDFTKPGLISAEIAM